MSQDNMKLPCREEICRVGCVLMLCGRRVDGREPGALCWHQGMLSLPLGTFIRSRKDLAVCLTQHCPSVLVPSFKGF